MIVRLIKKLVVTLTLFLGIALLILWSRTRHSDLLISGASGGTYRELRLGNSQLALTFVTTWPQGQHLRVGRPAAAAKPQVIPPALNGSSAIVTTPSATLTVSGGTLTLTNAAGATVQTLALFDGAHLMLQPSAAGWWPPTKSTGSAMLSDSPRANMTGTAGMVAISGNTITSTATSPSGIGTGTGITTTAPGTLTIVAAGSPPPTTLPASGVTSGSLTFSTSPAKGGQFSFSGATSVTTLNIGNPATAPSISGSTMTWTALTIFTAHAYERYALSVWAVVMIVMLPVWWAILKAALRAQRRRSRRRKGLCERCGYDLRGNPTGSTCPECGTATAGIPAPPTGDALLARLK